MNNTQQQPRVVKLPGQRRRNIASTLLSLHPLHSPSSSHLLSKPPPPASDTGTPIRIICISDTHNHQPPLPQDGDILLHAGDLTENGSFDELQTQLNWLSAQPYRHKVVVAGNHDVLLDEEFLERYPERRYGENCRTKEDLDWGDVKYLCDSAVTLDFSPTSAAATSTASHNDNDDNNNDTKPKTLTIYGTPQTPQYGISAFQYNPNNDANNQEDPPFTDKIPPGTDIVLTHGPAKFHLDSAGPHRAAGCPLLGREIVGRVRPRLVVCGHIHASYGREDVVVDAVRGLYEGVMVDWEGVECLGRLGLMGVRVLWGRVVALFRGRERMVGKERVTTFVNASVVGGRGNELRNEPVVVQLQL